MRTARIVAACLTALAIAPVATATAAEGRGAGLKHLKNIPFPDLNDKGAKNQGTDLEFATITIPQPVAPAVAAPPAPARKPASKKKSTKRKKSAYERRCRTKRQKRTKWCRREAAKRRAAARRRAAAKRKARTRDAQPSVPGLQRTFGFVGSYSDGLQIFDMTDGANPELVSTWDCGISQGDVQVFKRDDLGGGTRWFASYAHDDGYDFYAESKCATELTALGFKPQSSNGGAGTYIAEVTDPYNPKAISFVPVEQGSHNQTIHPSGKYLYNSNSDLITSFLPAIEIFDLTDITKPKEIAEHTLLTFPGLGTEAHDIDFNDDGSRAYVAALSHGEILDTSNPASPETVGHVFDPAINVWHQADAVTVDDPVLGERTFLIAEDEVAGAIGTGQCPNGAVHVYDMTGPLEAAPVKVGVWNIDDVGPTEDGVGTVVDDGGTCTAHVFQLHEKEKLMTIAYYNGGVRVVDLTGLVGAALGDTGVLGMKQVGWYRFEDSNTWAVKTPKADRKGFYMYGGDHRRGLDVYQYTPGATSAKTVSPGRWLTPEQGLAQARKLRANGAKPRLAALCLLNSAPRAELEAAAARAGLSL